MLKKINGKQFDLGALYVAPWVLTDWKDGCTLIISDGEIVVLLDIEEFPHHKYSDYKLRLLTIEGEVAEIYSTGAGLDYWKTAEQIKKNKKF